MQLNFEIVSSWVSLWITTVVLFAFIHFFLIEVMREKPYYAQWFIIRGFFALLYILPFQLLKVGEGVPIWTFQVTSHIVIFNPLLNKLRDLKYVNMAWNTLAATQRFPFWYLGEHSGWLDKLLGRLGPTFYQCFYYACCAVMVLSLITIYFRYA